MADQLTLLLGDSPAKTYRLPATKEACRPSVQVFGTKCCEFVVRLCRVTSSWKTSQTSLLESADAGLLPSSVTWPRSGMMCSGTVYRLPPLAPFIGEIGYGLLPTPLKSDGISMKRFSIRSQVKSQIAGHQERIWPSLLVISKFDLKRYCKTIESLMGYPPRWTRLEP